MSTNGRIGGGASGDAERDPRIDRLYREAPREEPPAHLDAAILAAAHREVGARPRAASERLRAWRVPVSIAAVVVLSVSVVTLVREEGGDKLDSSTASTASRNVSGAPAPQMAEERAGTRDRAAPAPGGAGEQEASKPEAARDDAPAAAKEEAGARASAESAKLSEEAARRRSAGAASGLSAAEEPRAPVPAPAAPATQSRRDGPPLRDPRPAPSTGASSGADPARSAAGIRGSGGDTFFAPSPAEQKSQGASAPLPQGAPAEAPQGASVDRPVVRERSAAADSAGSLSMQRQAPARAAKAAPRAESLSAQESAAGTAGRLAPLLKELEAQPAERWAEKIEALRRDGRRTEADELLAEFRRRFPDYLLPAELR